MKSLRISSSRVPTNFSLKSNELPHYLQEKMRMTTVLASDQLAQAAFTFLQEQLQDAQRSCITSSFQAEDVVVVHMARQIKPEIPVLFLETGYHFPETL